MEKMLFNVLVCNRHLNELSDELPSVLDHNLCPNELHMGSSQNDLFALAFGQFTHED
jgi:hypothetical protein